MVDADQGQAGNIGWFPPPQGGPLKEGWIFDNEIDWVMRIRIYPRTSSRKTVGGISCMDDAIQGRAHCRAVEIQRMQVFKCKKSVFRSAIR